MVKVGMAENWNSAFMYFLISSGCMLFILFIGIISGDFTVASGDFSNNYGGLSDSDLVIALFIVVILASVSLGIYEIVLTYGIFKKSTQKLRQTYKVLLPATVTEKFLSNLFISQLTYPLFIAVVQIIIPLALICYCSDEKFAKDFFGFYASPAFVYYCVGLIILCGYVIVVSQIRRWRKVSGFFLAIVLLRVLDIHELVNASNPEWARLAKAVVYGATVVGIWVISFVVFKRREIKS